MAELTEIEKYAIKLVADGGESFAEDDLNEDGEIADEHHQAACQLAIWITHAISRYPNAVLALVREEQAAIATLNAIVGPPTTLETPS